MNFSNFLNEETSAKVKYKLTKNSALGKLVIKDNKLGEYIVDMNNDWNESEWQAKDGELYKYTTDDIYFTHIEPLSNGNFNLHFILLYNGVMHHTISFEFDRKCEEVDHDYTPDIVEHKSKEEALAYIKKQGGIAYKDI